MCFKMFIGLNLTIVLVLYLKLVMFLDHIPVIVKMEVTQKVGGSSAQL